MALLKESWVDRVMGDSSDKVGVDSGEVREGYDGRGWLGLWKVASGSRIAMSWWTVVALWCGVVMFM